MDFVKGSFDYKGVLDAYMPEMRDLVEELYSGGVGLHCVTRSDPSSASRIKAELDSYYGGAIMEVLTVDYMKGSLCRENGFAFHVDDDVIQAVDCARQGLIGIHLGYPSDWPSHESLHHAFMPEEILDILRSRGIIK